MDQFLQLFVEHMGIDLRGRNVGMAEQFLHGAQVCTVLQKVAGKGVAQHVRRHGGGRNAGAGRKRLEVAGENLARQIALLAAGGKELRAVGAILGCGVSLQRGAIGVQSGNGRP